MIHPLRMIVNGSYGILQLDNRDNHLWQVDYRNGIENVWLNLRDPFRAIRSTDGWDDFFVTEVIPFSFNAESARYWPNYTQHLIGGGMSYRMIAEWYRWHGASHPRVWSVATMAVYHVWNEVVENDRLVGYTTDPIADLYIFDPLGIWLFDHDGVSRFFSQTLHMADWSYQPAYDPVRRTLENNGQNFAFKLGLPWSPRWSLFYYFGTHGELGLSYARANGGAFSVAGGLRASDLVQLDSDDRTVDLVPAAGVFYDRDNSLLFSLLYAATKDYAVRLNLYPGLARVAGISPGLFVAVNRDGRTVAGITFGSRLGLPVGYGAQF